VGQFLKPYHQLEHTELQTALCRRRDGKPMTAHDSFAQASGSQAWPFVFRL
jgi:hypothetical protein